MMLLTGPGVGRLMAQTVSQSKISAHLIRSYTPGARQIVAGQPQLLKILDLGSDMLAAARDYKARVPEGKIVLRIFSTAYYRLQDNPEQSATNFWNTALRPPLDALSASDRALIDYLEGPNEGNNTPNLDTPGGGADWLSRFWVALAPLAAQAGFRPCIGSIGVGGPTGTLPEIQAKLAAFVPALRTALSLGGAWSYHAYTTHYTNDLGVEIWYSLRYRQFYTYFRQSYPDLAAMTLILSEGGVDYSGDPVTSGWQARGTADDYKNWLRWFDQSLRQDSYVLGCTLFQIGDPGGWPSFDLEPIAAWLGDYLSGRPVIGLTPSAITASTLQGTNPVNQTFTVANEGGASLAYTITQDASWLLALPTNGVSTGEKDSITLRWDAASLSPGTYAGVVTVASTNAKNSPQNLPVTLLVKSTNFSTIIQDFESMPAWWSSLDAAWGGAAVWSVVAGGPSGNALQAARSNTGSSAKVMVFDLLPGANYVVSVYMRCPSSSASYWAECAFKLGRLGAQDFDTNSGSWTMIQKFSNTGLNGNGGVWIRYAKGFSSGTNLDLSVGFKLGASSGLAPTVQWDTLRIERVDLPRLLWAVNDWASNTVTAVFAQPLDTASASNRLNYILRRLDTGAGLTVVRGTVSDGSNVVLTTGSQLPGVNYSLTAANIGPATPTGTWSGKNGQAAVLAPLTLATFDAATLWSYNDAGTDLGTGWRELDFDDSAWPAGAALFAEDGPPLPEPARTQLAASTTPVTCYFRRGFVWPFATNVVALRVREIISDGVACYMNGAEISRLGLTNAPLGFADLASRFIATPSWEGPFYLSVSNLVSGRNLLAAEVHRGSAPDSRIVFGAVLEALLPPSQLACETPRLILSRQGDRFTLSWLGSGLKLDFAETIPGTWTEVTEATNPFLIEPTRAAGFYRLRGSDPIHGIVGNDRM